MTIASDADTGDATASPLPRRLNHVAYVTRSTEVTRRFYTDILGMPLVGHAEEDTVGSTGEAMHFIHSFFAMGDGSCIAFFEIEGQPHDHNDVEVLPRWAAHLAMSVESKAELDAALARLRAHHIEVIGPVDHEGIWTSIYFFDPNGVRLELTHQRRPLTAQDAAAAAAAVEAWSAGRTEELR